MHRCACGAVAVRRPFFSRAASARRRVCVRARLSFAARERSKGVLPRRPPPMHGARWPAAPRHSVWCNEREPLIPRLIAVSLLFAPPSLQQAGTRLAAPRQHLREGAVPRGCVVLGAGALVFLSRARAPFLMSPSSLKHETGDAQRADRQAPLLVLRRRRARGGGSRCVRGCVCRALGDEMRAVE